MDEVGLNNYLQSLKENLVFKNFHNNIINSQELTIEQINKNLFSANNIEEFKLVSLKDIVLSGYNLQTDHLNYIDELREKMSKRVESYSRGREDETDKGSSPPPPGRARRSPTMKKTARATVAGATAARATTEGSPTARATVARTQPASPDPTDEPAPQLPPPGGHASRVRKSAARATTEKDPTDDIRKSEEALRERRERRKMKLKAETLDRRSDGVMAVHREAKRQTERLLQEGRENYHGS